MNVDNLIAALNLPQEARVDRRVPKTLLVENGAPTAADKRRINEGIEEVLWLATLKPNTIGVPEYRDNVREYLEIAVLSLALRPEAKADRLVELIHRAIPYPVVLLAEQDNRGSLSVAHKRWSQGEGGKMVLDDTILLCDLTDRGSTAELLESLALNRQPRAHLLDLYQGWINCLDAFQAAQVIGRFVLPSSGEEALARRTALVDHDRLTSRIDSLRAQATRETQINRRVELNLEIRRLEAERLAIRNQL